MFEDAFKLLIEHEGRALTDGQNDHISRFGITLENYGNDFFARAHITEDEAKKWYLDNYWTPLRLDEIKDSKLSTILFDQCVNQGSPTIIKRLQSLLNLTTDGVMGSKTIEAINASNAKEVSFKLLMLNMQAYIQICQKNPKKVTFLLGWTNRVFSLLSYLFN
jgi:lysozyme family protein